MSELVRPGIILTVTGIIVLGHYALTQRGFLPRRYELLIGIVLLVIGVPLLLVGILAR